MVQIDQIYNWSHGKWQAYHGNMEISELLIDSRKISQPEQSLFIALSAPRRDGHSFISDAYEKGVRNFLVHQPVPVEKYEGANFILVNDTLLALQQIVAAYR